MRRSCRVLLLTVGLLVMQHSAAWAGWSAPLSEWSVIAPYGAECPSGTHRGVDLAAEAGAAVVAPSSGSVAFAGRVPADGGGTCGAVTIDTPDGLRISLMPLDEVSVTAGSGIVVGDALGTLAATGDASSAEPHLHLGLRRGDAYLDPTALLPATPVAAPPVAPSVPIAGVSQEGPGAAAPPGATAGSAATSPSLAVAHSATQVVSASAAGAEQSATTGLSASVRSRQLLADGGAPEPSVLRPELRLADRRVTLSVPPVSPQQGISVALLLGMLAVAAGIAVPRLAAARSS